MAIYIVQRTLLLPFRPENCVTNKGAREPDNATGYEPRMPMHT